MPVLSKTFSLSGSLLLVLLAICFLGLPAQAQPWVGGGEPNEPYLVYDANEMQAIGADPNYWDAHFKLMADIDLAGFTGTQFNIIGHDWGNAFTGVFDGNGHTISNFTYTSTGTSNIGLFGYVDDPNAEINDLRLIDPNVDAGTGRYIASLVGYLIQGTLTNCYAECGSVEGNECVSGLVGYNEYGRIINCYSTVSVSGMGLVGGLVGWNLGDISNSYSGTSVSGNTIVGGLVGWNHGDISNCYSSASVSGDYVVGGLAGYNLWGTITNCYSTGNVTGAYDVGGLVGVNQESTITECYSSGNVAGSHYVGGLVGLNKAQVLNSYSTGNVSGVESVGGLMGYNDGTVSASFWDIDTSGEDWSGGGTGLPTAQMQLMSTFTDAGWDFVGETANGTDDIWWILEGADYPHLRWENLIPVADAGPDREAYAWIDGIAEVTLDGTNSYDEDGQPLTYLWSWAVDSNTLTATEPNLTIELPVGEHIIELIVNDGIDDSEPNEVVITVIEPIQSQLWIVPRVINRRSHQPKILALLRLPEGVTKDQVDSDQPLLLYPGGIEAIRQYIFQSHRRRAQQTSILAFFDKDELMNAIPDGGRVELQVVGQLKTGQYFYGTDTVRIIRRQRKPTGGSGDNQRVTVPLNR